MVRPSLLNGEDSLLLLDVGGDDVVEEEEGLGVRSHVDVVLEVREEGAVHDGLRVILGGKLVPLRKGRQVNIDFEGFTMCSTIVCKI